MDQNDDTSEICERRTHKSIPNLEVEQHHVAVLDHHDPRRSSPVERDLCRCRAADDPAESI